MEEKFIEIMKLLNQPSSDNHKTLVLRYYIKELCDAHNDFINILDKIQLMFRESDNEINYKELYDSICKQNQQEGDFYRTFGPYLTLWNVFNSNLFNSNVFNSNAFNSNLINSNDEGSQPPQQYN